jgi:inorganic pyrophosphatase
MDLRKIPAGRRPPADFNALIETPAGGEPVRYRLDRASGALFVERFLHVAMRYPANYGFIPGTLGADGDPLHVLVVNDAAVVPGTIVRCRPIGALLADDETTVHEKIVAVPIETIDPFYKDVRSPSDLPETLVEQIAHFIEHYADLGGGKQSERPHWVGPDVAQALLSTAIKHYEEHAAAAESSATQLHDQR